METTTEAACLRSRSEKEVVWGKAFEWEIRGAEVEEVWRVTSDFVGVDKWMTTLVQSCELIEGEPQKPGCVRKPLLYPAAPGKPFTFAFEKLLEMDEIHHHYTYTILSGTLPGFSLMRDYVSTFKLLPLPKDGTKEGEDKGTLLKWSFVCSPIPTLSEEQSRTIAFSLYKSAVNDLKTHLSLSDDNITLISEAS